MRQKDGFTLFIEVVAQIMLALLYVFVLLPFKILFYCMRLL